MSALVFKLLLHLCVWSRILQANGIQNLRFPARFNNNQWRFGKRHDFLAKSRFFVWKPAISPGQIYSNVKTPAIPFNFNRYGIQSPPIMAPIHQSYMITIPTKVNYASYQPIKEIEEKRKPGNLHHITIINAIMPKPYLPTTPTHSHPATTFQNYRTNNKQFYNQYFNSFGLQNMDNLNKINSHQIQLQQQQHQSFQLGFPSSPLPLQPNRPTIDYMNVKNNNTIANKNIEHENEELTPISQCGRKTRDDANNSASDVLYYYCNNRITNYKNPTQQQIIPIQPTKFSFPTSTSTTTTTATTTTTEVSSSTTAKSSNNDFNNFSTERAIFLPTPNTPLEKSFVPITSATILKNFVTDSENDDSFKLQRQRHIQKKYERQRQTASRHEDIKRQQQYTTASVYDNMKYHTFFTIEDAVTRAPEMQVFNDPYQAYRHARRQKINYQRQLSTTTKLPDTTTATIKPRFKSFFDDLDDEDYPGAYGHVNRQLINYQRKTSTTPKTPNIITTTNKAKFKSFFDDLNDEDYMTREAQQYDYSLFNSPPKSNFLKSEFKNEYQVPKANELIYKSAEGNEFTATDETFMGRAKIKEHNFGLFKEISSTRSTYTLSDITTSKPNGNFKELFLTTNEIPSSTSYDPSSVIYTTNSDIMFENSQAEIRKENKSAAFLNHVRTTTTTPITTTTETNTMKLTFKPPLNSKFSTTLKYPKQRRLHKSYKNLTSTTTKATTTLKKVPKYQRQYKTKKLKEFKHLYTTTSTTTSSTTTTAIPTTIETHTKRTSVRILPTTSTTDEQTTKKAVFSRTYSTTEVPKQKNVRQQSALTTEASKRKKIKPRTSTSSTLIVDEPSIRLQSARRGSKRANVTRSEKNTTQVTMPKINNKNRRRIKTSSSTTARSSISRTSMAISTTSTSSTVQAPASLRTSSTTTTMKSIMRIANSKSRTRLHNDVRTPIRASNQASDDQQAFDEKIYLKSITSTIASVPPLPIEIYFKKTHNPKI